MKLEVAFIMLGAMTLLGILFAADVAVVGDGTIRHPIRWGFQLNGVAHWLQ
jgi:hypothetical protein